MDKNPDAAELTACSLHDAVKPVLNGAAGIEQVARGLDDLLPVPRRIGGGAIRQLTHGGRPATY